jgi:hypothetical protein
MERLFLDAPGDVTQLVDGNGFALSRLHAGDTARHIVTDIRRSRSPAIIVWDGRNATTRRRAFYPLYKTGRKPMGEGLFASIRLIKELCRHIPCVQVEVPEWEADDVLASLAVHRATRGQKVRVVTVDRDLYQLAVHPLVEVTAKYEHVMPHYVRLYKTFVGDPSDTVKGVPRFGEKAWEVLNKEAANKLLASDASEWGDDPLGLSPKHFDWCRNNFEELRKLWLVVGLQAVAMDEVTSCFEVGIENQGKVESLLREFML